MIKYVKYLINYLKNYVFVLVIQIFKYSENNMIHFCLKVSN